MVSTPDRKFLIHSIALLNIGVALVSVSLITSALITTQSIPDASSVPLFASDFQFLKRHLDYLAQVGGNAYENPDFYISIWVLIVPAILLAYYQVSHRSALLIILAVLLYAGLLEYSRAGLLLVATAAIVTIAVRIFTTREWSWLPAVLLLLLAVMHFNEATASYFFSGLKQFEQRISGHRRYPELIMSGDRSGDERGVSLHKGIEAGLQRPWTGIGYGTYRMYEPVPPHSTLIYRFAEGGLFGALSILLLAIYAPLLLVSALWHREKDLLLYAGLIGTICFMFKGMLFSASFSLNGLVVWGFAFAALTVLTFPPFGETRQPVFDRMDAPCS